MTCREFADFMMDYSSGELSPEVQGQFDRHLKLCPNCQKYLAGYQKTIKLGKKAFDEEEAPVPGAVPEELVKAILTARRS